jgi:hypothetical protein
MSIRDILDICGIVGLASFLAQLFLFAMIATEYLSTRWFPLWQVELFSYLQIVTGIGIVMFTMANLERSSGI